MYSRRAGRVFLPLLVGLVLPAAVAWLAWSITHLIGSVNTYHVRVLARPAGSPMPTPAAVQRLLAEQNHWGVLAMFAVAAVAAVLVLSLVTWLLGGPRPNRREP